MHHSFGILNRAHYKETVQNKGREVFWPGQWRYLADPLKMCLAADSRESGSDGSGTGVSPCVGARFARGRRPCTNPGGAVPLNFGYLSTCHAWMG